MKNVLVLALIAGLALTACKHGLTDEQEKRISDSLAARSRDSDMNVINKMLKKNRDSAAKADSAKK